jgi:hypothetical protein
MKRMLASASAAVSLMLFCAIVTPSGGFAQGV